MTDTGKGPYSRVYHSLMDDPDFEGVFEDDRLFATWTRMLMTADAFWPNSAPISHRNRAVSRLIERGLVIELRGNRYTIRGLSAERERRSASARNAAAVRWENERSARGMPRREETRKEEKRGANAPKSGPDDRLSPKPGEHLGQHPNCGVCAAIPKASADEQLADQWKPCARCGKRKGGPEHGPSRDHEFEESHAAA